MINKKLIRSIRQTLEIIVFSLAITLFVRSYVVEARVIPSPSMKPTLEIGDRLLIEKFLFKFTDLERLDIVVFKAPKNVAGGTGKDFIKRIIGLPGDTVEISNQRVIVNGNPINEPYIAQKPTYRFGPITVPEEKVFVLGDNRNNSYDSHEWGFLPIANIKGRAFLRYWPISRLGVIQVK